MTLIMHAADLHQGFWQYGSAVRRDDFTAAFNWLAREAIANEVDCLLIAGDLFHGGAFRPKTLWEAARILEDLKNAGVTVLAVEGNHDKPRLLAEMSWLDYLARRQLLILLDSQLKDGKLDFCPWNGQRLYGAHYSLPIKIEVVGARYQGVALSEFVDALVPALRRLNTELPDETFIILMMHEGVEGVIQQVPGGLTSDELNRLKLYVDYLALGHIHMPFTKLRGRVHNPGSLETCSVTEAKWHDRGYLLLDVGASTKDHPKRAVSVTRVPYDGRRKFLQLVWEMDRFANPEQFYANVDLKQMETSRKDWGHPVLELRLVGTLRFPRELLDMKRIRQVFISIYEPTVCRIKDLTERDSAGILVGENLTRAETEYQVIWGLLKRDVPEEQVEAWVLLTQDLKDLSLGKAAADQITVNVRSFNKSLEEACSERS